MKELDTKSCKNPDGRYIVLKNCTIMSTIINPNTPYQPYVMGPALKQITPGSVVVDVGANIGTFTIPFAKATGDNGIVHAFEPQRIIHQLLCTNVIVNKLSNVHTHDVGLSDKARLGKIATQHHKNYTCFDKLPFTHSKISETDEGNDIEIRTLDSYGLTNVSFIKYDVETHELQCIVGSKNTILSNKASFVFESTRLTSEQKREGAKIDQYVQNTLNYKITPLKRPSGQARDFLCAPK